MRSPLALLIILPGWALAYLTPPPLSRSVAAPGAGSALPQKPSTGCTPFWTVREDLVKPPIEDGRGRQSTALAVRRCSGKNSQRVGGLGKRGELMELMAKAKRDRAKKELEDRLWESGDLPGENSKPIKPTGANIKAERSWRNGGATSTTAAGGDKAADPVASAPTAAGISRVSPELENPRASCAEYESLRNKAEWEAVLAGRPSVANRSPVASKSECDGFESILTHGTPSRSRGHGDGVVSPEVLERKVLQEMEKQAPAGYSAGEFAPLDPWRALSNTDGGKVNFGLYRGIRPLLVVADPRQGSSEMREAMQQLNTRMPRKMGNTKIFIKNPHTLFDLEDQRTPALFPVAVVMLGGISAVAATFDSSR